MMDKTGLFLIAANTALCTVCALCLGFLGWRYDAIGQGLNPMVAYPLATLFFAAPFVWVSSIRSNDND